MEMYDFSHFINYLTLQIYINILKKQDAQVFIIRNSYSQRGKDKYFNRIQMKSIESYLIVFRLQLIIVFLQT